LGLLILSGGQLSDDSQEGSRWQYWAICVVLIDICRTSSLKDLPDNFPDISSDNMKSFASRTAAQYGLERTSLLFEQVPPRASAGPIRAMIRKMSTKFLLVAVTTPPREVEYVGYPDWASSEQRARYTGDRDPFRRHYVPLQQHRRCVGGPQRATSSSPRQPGLCCDVAEELAIRRARQYEQGLCVRAVSRGALYNLAPEDRNRFGARSWSKSVHPEDNQDPRDRLPTMTTLAFILWWAHSTCEEQRSLIVWVKEWVAITEGVELSEWIRFDQFYSTSGERNWHAEYPGRALDKNTQRLPAAWVQCLRQLYLDRQPGASQVNDTATNWARVLWPSTQHLEIPVKIQQPLSEVFVRIKHRYDKMRRGVHQPAAQSWSAPAAPSTATHKRYGSITITSYETLAHRVRQDDLLRLGLWQNNWKDHATNNDTAREANGQGRGQHHH
ncbi:MAG: hypothetical protein M1815_003450, partial [Lichina confinis]